MNDIYILGVNLSHDASVCLLKNDQIVVAIESERITRVKHQRVIITEAINYCLYQANIDFDDVDFIVIEKDYLGKLRKILNNYKIKIYSVSHHLLHAYSVFYCSNFTKANVFVADGAGSVKKEQAQSLYEAESLYQFNKNKYKIIDKRYCSRFLDQQYAIDSLGHMYDFVAGYCFQDMHDAGKVMALAPLGDYQNINFEMIECQQGKLSFNKDWQQSFNGNNQWQQGDKKCVDLASKVQAELAKVILCKINILDNNNQDNLCLAGGVFLNGLVNKKILDKTSIKDLFIQPAATDDGLAIGGVLYGWHKVLNKFERIEFNNVYFGKAYPNHEIKSAICGLLNLEIEERTTKDIVRYASKKIAQGKIVSWFQNGAEFGPRALGNRSILADPRSNKIKGLLNQKIKFRENFRPYAASILKEHLNDYFDLQHESPYMLLIAKVNENKKEKVPGVLHVDNTSRIQTVDQNNGLFYDLLNEFYKQTGLPLLLNTSFNKQEPIVETPADAINTFINTDIDILIIGNYIIDKDEYDLEKRNLFYLNFLGLEITRELIKKYEKLLFPLKIGDKISGLKFVNCLLIKDKIKDNKLYLELFFIDRDCEEIKFILIDKKARDLFNLKNEREVNGFVFGIDQHIKLSEDVNSHALFEFISKLLSKNISRINFNF